MTEPGIFLFGFWKLLGFQGFHDVDVDGNRTGQRQQIRYGLSKLNTGQPEEETQNKDSWNEENALSCNGQERRRNSTANRLLHHITHNDPALCRKADALETQGQSTVLDYLRIILEPGYDFGGEDKHQNTDSEQKHQGDLNAKPETVPDPLVQPGSKIEAADGLKALTEANHSGGSEHHDPLNDAHSSHSVIGVATGCPIQANGCQRGQALTGQRGESSLNDHAVIKQLKLKPSDMNMDVATL